MQSKGQLSLFVITGILIILIGAGIFAVSKIHRISPPTSQPDIQSQARVIVESCLQRSAEAGTVYIASQGGYNTIPPTVLTYDGVIPYYRFINLSSSINLLTSIHLSTHESPTSNARPAITTPSIHDVELGIAQFIEDDIETCNLELQDLEHEGRRIIAGKPKAKVEIGPAMHVTLNFPIKIFSGSDVYTMETFSTTQPTTIPILLDTARSISLFNDSIQLKTIDELALKHHLFVDILLDDETVIYALHNTPNNTLNNTLDEPYNVTWTFAAEYGWHP